MLGFGALIYASILLTNAMAILSEERFLARSPSPLTDHSLFH